MYGGSVDQPPEGVPHNFGDLWWTMRPGIAPFLPYLQKNLTLTYEDPGQGRLGLTRFEIDLNELERRRRFKMGPGKITILLHPDLNGDAALRNHTLAHELLHASGITSHNSTHSRIVDEIAPAPRLKDSLVLQKMRQKSWSPFLRGHGSVGIVVMLGRGGA